MYQFEKQFRFEKPETIGEEDSVFDLDNYKDWLEEKLIQSIIALEELSSKVKQYAIGSTETIDYFRDELKLANDALVPLDKL